MNRVWLVSAGLALVVAGVPLGAQAQTGTIHGTVVDSATLRPLVGVSISFNGRRALTRGDGAYMIADVPAGTDSLRARLIGYSPFARMITVRAGDATEVSFSLAQSAVQLSELVATGYGEQRAGNVTGAVTQLGSDEFNRGRNIAPAQLIQSKIPGVQVVDNNEPGGGISIRIRGATSINASSEPLYVIDGVPVGGGAGGGLSAGRDPLNFLNPDDIASMTVLRDASAAAIYGANAANGVVLITTKSGRGRPSLEYTGTISGMAVTRLPSMLNAQQFRSAVEQYAPQNVNQLSDANTDWFSLVDRTGIGQEHNVAVSGSTEGMSWRVSGGYLNQDGIIKGTTAERMSLGFNMDQRLFSDRLTVQTSILGARTKDLFTPGGVLSNAAQMGPTQPVMDPSTTTGYYNWPNNALASADNPVEALNLVTDRGITYRSLGSVQAGYRMPFLDALKANVRLGYDLTRTDRNTFSPGTIHSQTKTGNGGNDYRANQSALGTTMEAFLNYATPVNFIPGSIDLVGGYSYSFGHAEYPWYSANGLGTDLLGGNGVTTARTVQNFQDIQESKFISYFGRATYNINDKYILAGSVRRDGSSRFGPDNAWGIFPSVSGAWRLSEEDFLKGGAFSDLKLRASWAKTGNQAFANYQQYATYRTGDGQTQVQFGDQFVATVRPSAVDRNIRWEETKALNLGLDFGFDDNRITGSVDWYDKKTSDLIFSVPVAAGTNLSNFVTTNIGSMKNTGIEFTLGMLLADGGKDGFSWSANFNASHNRNELVSINPFGGESQRILVGGVAGGVGTFIQELTPGQPINSFYVYEHIKGADGKPIYEDRQGIGSDGTFTGAADGTINEQDLYVDQNGDGKINQDDRRAFHDPAPKWIFGHSSYMTKGNFDLSFTIRAYVGNYTYNNVASNLGSYAEVTRASPYNLHSSVLETGFEQPQYLSDYYVEDASFLRMDNITLGYTFNTARTPIHVFGTIQNAFTITGYSGVDPTAGLGGIDNNIYPRSRTFTAGMSLKF